MTAHLPFPLLHFSLSSTPFPLHTFIYPFPSSLTTMLPDWAQKILQIIPEIRKGLAKGVILAFLYESIKFIPMIIIKLIVDYFVTGESNSVKLMYFIGGVLVSYLILGIIDHVAQRARYKWILHYETTILKKAKKKLLELHLGYHEAFNTGAQVSKITKGTHKLTELIWFTFEEFIPTLMQLVITVGLLLYEQWLLALLFALFTPLIMFITIHASRRVQPYRKFYHQKFDEAVGELGESLLNIATVKDYVQEKSQFQKFHALLEEYKQKASERWRVALSILVWRDVAINVGRVVTLATAAYLVVQGKISPGSLVLVYTLTERAFLGTYRIGRLYYYLEDAMESIHRLTALLQIEPAVKNLPDAVGVRSLRGEIQFDKVGFAYGKGSSILHDLELHIAPRQIVALVGRSGAGKSTVAKLLLRNYDVTSGVVVVDGKDIRKYKMEEYKQRVAAVSQTVEIFNRTVLQNILFADPRATRAEAIAAAKKAYAHEFIMQFSKGYDTVVGEKGVRLSGGQKQRISIARALLKNPDIYIFDEATSSLDTESEQYIQKSIFAIAGKKTTIIIAHRLSTIRKADVIVVMDKGRIVEQGTYEELLSRKGAFWKMVQLQAGEQDGIAVPSAQKGMHKGMLSLWHAKRDRCPVCAEGETTPSCAGGKTIPPSELPLLELRE